MKFILPLDPLNERKVDPDFKKEFNSITSLGFGVYLFDHDRFVSNGEFVSSSMDDKPERIVLRSWMLSENQYSNLFDILGKKNKILINSIDQYSNCHYYPNIYDKISRFSPKAVWFTDLTDESIIDNREKMGQVDVLIKDYVKSDKGSNGIFKLESTLSNEKFCEFVHKFKESRHNLFNKGIVLKEFVDLKKYGTKINEYRIFVLNHEIISVSQNSNLTGGSSPDIKFLESIIKGIDSNYFTIDIVEKENGDWMIVECGDGAVSALATNQNDLIYYINFLNFDKKCPSLN